jgi:hypothetical protein
MVEIMIHGRKYTHRCKVPIGKGKCTCVLICKKCEREVPDITWITSNGCKWCIRNKNESD